MRLSPPTAATLEPLDYHALRMLCFRTALVDLVRRWGVYVAVALLLFSAGSNAPLTIASATAGALLWPLRAAAAHGWAIVPTTLAYAVAGTLPVLTTRPLWWPSRWALAERSLPLDAASVRRSDRIFAVVLMTPWQALLVFGGIGVWWHEPADPAWWTVLAADAVASGLSLQAVLWWMRTARLGALRLPAFRAIGPQSARGRSKPAAIRVVGVVRALVLWPLTRGTAMRSAVALVAGTFVNTTCAVALPACSVSSAWTAAPLALAAFCATSTLRTATRRELQPSWRDRPALPIDRRRCERARGVVVLGPTAIGLAAFVASVCVAGTPFPATVLAAYCAVVGLGCAIEATTRETMPASDHAARWILLLSLAIAFGSGIDPQW